jgi:hypothetical protein
MVNKIWDRNEIGQPMGQGDGEPEQREPQFQDGKVVRFQPRKSRYDSGESHWAWMFAVAAATVATATVMAFSYRRARR